jgi:hypothetical protein
MVDENELEPTFDDHSDLFDPADRARAAKERAAEKALAEDEATTFLRNRRESYLRMFNTPDGEKVFADLRKFCRLDYAPWDADPRVHALLTGRYEVGRRILDHIDLTFDELVDKYTGKLEL